MMKLALSSALAAMLIPGLSAARAQDTDELAKLRAQIELLKKENELLKKEIELLKKEAKAKPDGAGGSKAGARSLSELLPAGTVLKGGYRATQGGGHGEITVTISERDGKKFKATTVARQMKDNKDVGTVDGEIEGVIDGARLTYKNIGAANKVNASLTLKGGDWRGLTRPRQGYPGPLASGSQSKVV